MTYKQYKSKVSKFSYIIGIKNKIPIIEDTTQAIVYTFIGDELQKVYSRKLGSRSVANFNLKEQLGLLQFQGNISKEELFLKLL